MEMKAVLIDGLERGDWENVLAALAGLVEADPVEAVNHRELASVVRLLAVGESMLALLRLEWSLVDEPAPEILDAVSTSVASALDADGEGKWAAIAWVSHRDGEAKTHQMLTKGLVTTAWLLEVLFVERV